MEEPVGGRRLVGVTRWGLLAGAALLVGGWWAGRRIAAVETLSAEAAAPGGAFCTVEGYRLHYLEAGPPDAPTVVLLHGFGTSAATWDAVMAALADEFHVVALDLLGLGYSQRSAVPIFTLRRRARQVAGLLDHLGVRRASLVGQALGGAVALQFAVGYPDRISRLVLVDAVAGYTGLGSAVAPLLGVVLRRTPLGKILLAALVYNDARLARLLARAYFDPARLGPARLAAYQAPRRVRGTADSLLAMAATRRDDDLPGALGRVRAPTLIIWGREDRWVKLEWAARLHADMPGSRMAWLPDCGHVPQEECAAAFSLLLGDFLREE